MLSVHQMEAVVGNFDINLLAQMGTDYSTPVICLLVGQHYRSTRRVFDIKVFQFVSVCLQSSWVPALRESSCLSGTAALLLQLKQSQSNLLQGHTKRFCSHVGEEALSFFYLRSKLT